MRHFDVIVLGAGIVGVSTAYQLQKQGLATALVDISEPGLGASFGNAGVIERECVLPFAMPRDIKSLLNAALGRSTEARLHWNSILYNLPFLARYWWHSETARHRKIAEQYAPLIENCIHAYDRMSHSCGIESLVKKNGMVVGFRDQAVFERAEIEVAWLRQNYGLEIEALTNSAATQKQVPGLSAGFAAAHYYKDPATTPDPHQLLTKIYQTFMGLGGTFHHANALELEIEQGAFRLASERGEIRSKYAVNALGAHAAALCKKQGLKVPLGIKRGYHQHYAVTEQPLNHTVIDAEYGYVILPTTTGIRLTTGAEFALPNTPKTPRQLEQVEPIAKALFPMGEALDPEPWMGLRPCMPDMLPVIGEMPGRANMWCAFGHGHNGLTLGPITGEIIAAQITGQKVPIDAMPFSPARFA